MIATKIRFAQLNSQSIPRLELSGALIQQTDENI